MLAAKQKSLKKTIIYVTIIVSMIVGNILIYNSNTQRTQINPNEDLLSRLEQEYGINTGSGSISNQNIENNPVLEHNLFYALKKVGNWPVVPQNVGRVNPFSPLN